MFVAYTTAIYPLQVQCLNISGKYGDGQQYLLWFLPISRLTDHPQKYSMEWSCPQDFKKYKTISVEGLRAEQFAIKVDRVYRDLQQ